MQDSAGHQPLTDLERSKRMLHALRDLQEELRVLHRDNAYLIRENRKLDTLPILEKELQKVRGELQRLRHSKSWRITRWLRIIEPMIRSGRGREHIVD